MYWRYSSSPSNRRLPSKHNPLVQRRAHEALMVCRPPIERTRCLRCSKRNTRTPSQISHRALSRLFSKPLGFFSTIFFILPIFLETLRSSSVHLLQPEASDRRTVGTPPKMAEQLYTVASDSETTGDDKQQSAFPDLAIGIDLGTSQCSVAIWNGGRVELLRNPRNQKLMRSYVMFKDEIPSGGVSEGLAYDEQERFSGSAVFNMKRLIGRMDTDPVVHASKTMPFLVETLDIGVRPFIAALVNNVWRSTTPEEVLAIFLVELKAMAEVQLKRPIRNAVLTIPVSFSRFQQTRIERACAMAGLHVLRLMPEPTCVALLYAQQQQGAVHENLGSGSEKVALIFNMGAGYCDVAITATAGGVSQIKALLGCAVGGEDILQNVLRHLMPNFDSFCSNHSMDKIKSMGLLRIATRDAIHKLSSQTSVHINVDMGDGTETSRVLDRSEFEEKNREVFDKCEKLIMQSLLDAKLVAEDVTDVILVGGCSNIPKVRSLVLRLCKRDVAYESIDPLEAAIRGAALEGAIASGISDPLGSLDLLTIQATPLSLGIRADGDGFATIIHRNTAIPARKDMLFTTVHDNQTEALIVVYEGEGKQAKENHLLGYFKITGILPAPKGTAEISVCMDIDASNVLSVGWCGPAKHSMACFSFHRSENADIG